MMSGFSKSKPSIIFVAWAIFAVVSTGFLMDKHLVAIEIPDVVYDVAVVNPEIERDRTITHIFSADCTCSERTMEGVLAARPLKTVHEVYIISGESPDWEDRFRIFGKHLEVLSSRELEARYRVGAGPFLIIQDKAGEVKYRGGYGARSYLRPDEIQDRTILAQLKSGKTPDQLPAFGCQF